MLLNEIAVGMTAKTINKAMAMFGSTITKFQELLDHCGLPDADDEVVAAKYLGWDDKGKYYKYVCIAEIEPNEEYLVAYFLVNFDKKGELSGDYPGNPIAEVDDEDAADKVFDKTVK